MSTIVRNVRNTRKSNETVYIGRGSIWGNPFTHLPLSRTQATVQVRTREEAVEAYKAWLGGTCYTDLEQERRQSILNCIHLLKGKTLLCYCYPQACHGDVLAEMADEEES